MPPPSDPSGGLAIKTYPGLFLAYASRSACSLGTTKVRGMKL